MEFLRKLVEIIIKKHRQLKRLYRTEFALACIVVFVTSYALTLPAVTLDRETAEASAGIGGFEVQGQASQESGESGGSMEEDQSEADAWSQEESEADAGPDLEADSETNSETDTETNIESDTETNIESDTETDTESNTETDARSDSGSGRDSDAGPDGEEAAETESAAAEGTDRESTDPQEPGGAADAGTAGTQTAPVPEPEGTLLPEGTVLHAAGNDYDVYVTITSKSEIYEGTTLEVREITKESDEEEYQRYFDKAQKELKDKYDDNTSLSFARFYDISFLYKGTKVEPAGKVNVRIEYEKAVEVTANAGLDTVHFDAQKEEKPEFIESELKTEDGLKIKTGAGSDAGNAADKIAENSRTVSSEAENALHVNEITFESDKFSVYGICGTETFEATVLAGDGRNYKIIP